MESFKVPQRVREACCQWKTPGLSQSPTPRAGSRCTVCSHAITQKTRQARATTLSFSQPATTRRSYPSLPVL